ncbi:unnamed protein product [Closterium sp. NIES-53]
MSDRGFPRWGDLLKSGVAIFDLDYDAILAAMYAVSITAEEDFYLCVPPDPGIEAAALGASDPVLAHSSTVLPCPAVPSGSLSGLHLPSFSMNLVSGADLQDVWVDQFTPGGQWVTHCSCTRTGRHLATFTRQPGSSLYTLTTVSPPVAESGQVAAMGQVFAAASRSGPESAPYSCGLLSHQTLLWHHRLGHPSLPRLRGMASRTLFSGLPRCLPPLPPGPAPTCVPCVEGRQRAAPHSSSFPPTEAPLQTLHMDILLPSHCCHRSRPASPVRAARTSRRGSRQRPPPVPGTHQMALRPSTAPQRVPLPSPPASSLPALADPLSDLARAASPTVMRLLATVVTDPSFESIAASALVAELVDFAAHCRSDYAASLVAESESVCPPSVGGECALSTDVLEDRQDEFQCFAAALPHLVSMLLAPKGDPDAPDIPTPRSYAEAIEGPYSSQWQTAMDAEMASWKSTGTYVNEVPPPGTNIIDGMWIFRVKRPPGSPPAFKARYVARGSSQRQGVDYFHTFSPTLKMTTLRVLLHVAAQRDYELHSLDFSTAFLQGSLHEEIWLRRPPGLTGSFPAGTQWSLRRPVYGLRQAPREWHDTLRTTLAALGFAPSTADPSLFLRTDNTLPPFYILVYVDDLVFATADTAGLVHVLQHFNFTYSSPQATPLSTRYSLSALPSDESVEPSGLYPELVGCTRPDLAYPLSIFARYVAPGRHRPKHMDAAKRVLRYLCSTSGMGLVLGGRARVVLTGHADASWVDDLATQWSSQGYTFSLGSGSVLWRSTRSSSVFSSSCEAEIYAVGATLRFAFVLLSVCVHACVHGMSSGSTTTRQSSLVNGGEEAKDAEEEEEEVQQVSERAPTLPSRNTSAPRIRVTPQQRQGLHVPAAEEEGRGKRRIQAPNRLTYDALGKPAKSALAGAALMVGEDEVSDYEECAFAFFSPVEMPGEPATLKEALESSDAEDWKKAMESELKSIEENGTWELVELPEGRKAITSKWLFKIKSDADGKIERYKSRLVAKGYQQKEKVDYKELFAPVVKPTTLRTLLAGAAINGWVVKQMDVTTAFLNGVLEEEIFMAQPEGFDDGSGRVLRLKKALYGLKQAPRQWYLKLRGVLEEIGFTPSTADHSLFMLGEGEQRSFMVVYVDDILVFSPSSDLVKEVMLKLQDKFKCKALGDVSFYLGLHIERDVEKLCMRVHQRKYLEALAVNFGQSEGHVATPFPSGFKCVKGPEEESVGEEERRRFHSLVGSLMYAAVNTRPDVAFATGQLARVVQCPNEEQVAAGMRVAKYLGQTPTVGLQYSTAAQRRQKGADGVEPGRLFLTAFSDASYASEPEDMTSVGGFICCVGGGPTAWESKKQVDQALSSVESEYMTLFRAVREIVWQRRLLAELGEEQQGPTPLYCDSQGAIALAKNPVLHGLTKHMRVNWHWTRSMVAAGEVELHYVKTTRQPADMMTKRLVEQQQWKCCKLAGMALN